MTNHCKSQITNGRGDTEDPEVSRRDFFQHTVGGAVVVGALAVAAMTMSGPVQAQYGGGPYVWKSIATYRDSPNGPQFLRPMRPFPPTCGMSDRRAADQPEWLVPLLLSAAGRALSATRGCWPDILRRALRLEKSITHPI
jgi:hypothetical protein